MVAILVLLMVLAFVTVDLYRLRRRRLPSSEVVPQRRTPAHLMTPLIDPQYRTPPSVFFHPGHTWLYLEEDGTAKLGVDDFARNVVGRIDEVETQSPGRSVLAGDVILRLRQGARSVGFKAPVDCQIEAINSTVAMTRDVHAYGPLTDSWLYRITPKDTSTVAERLLIGRKAADWLRHEVSRLRVFLSTIAKDHSALGATAQDGGMPVSGLIGHLDDEGWNKLRDTFFGE